MIEFLPWETDFFSMKIGKANGEQCSIDEIIRQKESERYELIVISYDAFNFDIDAFIASNNGILADKKVTYHKCLDDNVIFPPEISFHKGPLTDELSELAILSGHLSRFNQDFRLRAKCKQMFIKWIENSLNGQLADKVMVYREDGHISGFVTIKQHDFAGQIGLISVSEKLQGKGVGSKLIQACDSWLQRNNATKYEVVTQQNNVGACRLYEKNGFSVKNVKYIYHL